MRLGQAGIAVVMLMLMLMLMRKKTHRSMRMVAMMRLGCRGHQARRSESEAKPDHNGRRTATNRHATLPHTQASLNRCRAS
jgi:hypothetical protein